MAEEISAKNNIKYEIDYDISYKELIDFYDKTLPNLNMEERVKLYLNYKNKNKPNSENELKKYIISLFPKVYEGQELKIDFIDPNQEMAVITIYRDIEVIGYFAYVKGEGLVGYSFDSFDFAVVGCLNKKYESKIAENRNGNYLDVPKHTWIAQILGIKTEKEIKEELKKILIKNVRKEIKKDKVAEIVEDKIENKVKEEIKKDNVEKHDIKEDTAKIEEKTKENTKGNKGENE